MLPNYSDGWWPRSPDPHIWDQNGAIDVYWIRGGEWVKRLLMIT
ncbi:hypothetical protein [Micromonospora sp. NPDC005172]